MPLIEIERASKFFGSTAALYQLTLQISAGTIAFLRGPNGAGKSTLLRCLSGIQSLDSGSIKLSDLSPRTFIRKHGERLGVLLPESMLYQDLTVTENLELFAALYQIRNPTRDISRALDAVGHSSFEKSRQKKVKELSLGMKKRAALARALLPSPGILLLDEPFSNVDRESRDNFFQLVKKWREEGRTLICASHDEEAIAELADRVLGLHDGELRSDESRPGGQK